MQKEKQTITLYGFNTTNSIKILIMLYESNIEFNCVRINLDGQQFSPKFSKMNPNQKTPVLSVENTEGVLYLSESGAILDYLRTHHITGTTICFNTPKVMQWLMWQVSTQAPAAGNWAFFNFKTKDKNEVAIERFEKEIKRQLQLVESHLSNFEYLAGQYSIADIALFSWYHKLEQFGFDLTAYPNIQKWLITIHKRKAVVKALAFDFMNASELSSI